MIRTLQRQTYNQFLHKRHNISMNAANCGTFIELGDYNSLLYQQVIVNCLYFIIAVAVASFYVTTVIFVCRKLRNNKKSRNQKRPQEGIRLMTVVYLLSIPISLFESWNAYLIANSETFLPFSRISTSAAFHNLLPASMFVPSVIAFFGPFIYTFLTSSFIRQLKLLCKRCYKKRNKGYTALEEDAATSSTSAWPSTGDTTADTETSDLD